MWKIQCKIRIGCVWKLQLKKQQKKKLCFWLSFVWVIAVVYLSSAAGYLHHNNVDMEQEWEKKLRAAETLSAEEEEAAQEAILVNVSTYLEGIDNIDIRQSKYEMNFQVCFVWKDGVLLHGEPLINMEKRFTVYNGRITTQETLENKVSPEGIRIQRIRMNAAVNNVFDTTRFPLGSYQIRMYLMPNDDIKEIRWLPDVENCRVNEGLSIAGFALERFDSNIFYHRDTEKLHYDHQKVEEANHTYSELLTAMEFKRDSWGLYLKCIIALLGTSVWAFLMLGTCIHHRVDSLGMLPAVLFGTVSNILVGANLVPDAMETGLLEFINIWGIYTVIIISCAIMQTSHIRKNNGDEVFARLFGKWMLISILLTTVIGHILLPLSAFV